jgi:hypothetical protein
LELTGIDWNFLGLIRISWDGLEFSGIDWHFLELIGVSWN